VKCGVKGAKYLFHKRDVAKKAENDYIHDWHNQVGVTLEQNHGKINSSDECPTRWERICIARSNRQGKTTAW